MNLYKKCAVKPFSFLGIDATLASDSRLRYILEGIFQKEYKG